MDGERGRERDREEKRDTERETKGEGELDGTGVRKRWRERASKRE